VSATIDAKGFRELTLEELAQKLRELRDDLFKLRLRASVAQIENPARIRELRRAIARGETVRREMLRRADSSGAEQVP
jgi:large subunit ribosomal protein L29